MKKHILAVFVSSSMLVLTACGGGDGDTTSVIVDDGIPKNNIVNPVVRVESYTDIDSTVDTALSDASASKSLATYKMLGVDGADVAAPTIVFMP